MEKRSGNVFAIVEYRLLFFCLPFFGKGALILPFKENFFTPYYKENDRENKKGGVFFGREKIRKGDKRKGFHEGNQNENSKDKGGQQGKDRAEGEKGAGCEDDGETGGKAEAAHKEPRKGKAQDEPEGDRAGRSG